jgi:hypothetical protein
MHPVSKHAGMQGKPSSVSTVMGGVAKKRRVQATARKTPMPAKNVNASVLPRPTSMSGSGKKSAHGNIADRASVSHASTR